MKLLKKIIRKIDYKLNGGVRTIPIFQGTTNDKILEDRVALITGGSGGIGFAIAEKFIKTGAKVIISGTNEEKLKKNVKKLGKNADYVVLNIKKVEDIKLVFENAKEKFGKIDILVNAAGIHIDRDNLNFLNITEDEFDSVIEVNYKGTYFISQCFANYLIENKIKGNILMISSITELEPAWSPYRISKHGINALTEGLAQQLIDKNIIVNGIAPASTATNMLDYKEGDSIYSNDNLIERYVLPSEIAEIAVVLVSKLGQTIIGDTIYMSGGRGILRKN